MTPMALINEANDDPDGAGFTVNIWLRAGAQLRNIGVRIPHDGFKHPRDTHLEGVFQGAGNSVSIDFSEIAALEIDW